MVLPRQVRNIPRQRDPRVRRHGIVYGFNILDPATMQVRVDYVGKTIQKLAARERQHRGDDWETDPTEQPWSDLIVGKPLIVEEGWWTAAELAEREKYHIHRLLPRYNYEHNLDNPRRIPIPVARRQREERDRARGVPSPVWDRTPRAPVRHRSWTPGQRKAAVLAAVWLVLAVVGWVAAVRSLHASLTHGARDGAVGATVLYVAAWWNRKPRRRRPTRRSRRRRR